MSFTFSPRDLLIAALSIGNPNMKMTVSKPDGHGAFEILFHSVGGVQIPLFVDVSFENGQAVYGTGVFRTLPDGTLEQEDVVTLYGRDELDALLAYVLGVVRRAQIQVDSDPVVAAVDNGLLDHFQELALTLVTRESEITQIIAALVADPNNETVFRSLWDADEEIFDALAQKAGALGPEDQAERTYSLFSEKFSAFLKNADLMTLVLMFFIQDPDELTNIFV